MDLEQRRTLRNEAYNIAIDNLRKMGGNCGWALAMASSNDDDDIKTIKLLVNQFYYGIEAKNELLDMCIKVGWIKIDL